MITQIIKKLITIKKVTTMKEGTVKFFNRTKGFGFIKVDDSEEEVFVHKNDLIDIIDENDKVTFDIEKSQKGMNAVNVKLI